MKSPRHRQLHAIGWWCVAACVPLACQAPATVSTLASANECRDLAGRWTAQLRRDSVVIEGTIEFRRAPRRTDGLTHLGSYRFAWDSLLRADDPELHSTSARPGSRKEILWGIGALQTSDSAYVALSYLVSHGPFNLAGSLRHDTVSGIWTQRTGRFAVIEPSGPFRLVRTRACR